MYFFKYNLIFSDSRRQIAKYSPPDRLRSAFLLSRPARSAGFNISGFQAVHFYRSIRLRLIFPFSEPNKLPALFGLDCHFFSPGRTEKLVCSAWMDVFIIRAEQARHFVRPGSIFSPAWPNHAMILTPGMRIRGPPELYPPHHSSTRDYSLSLLSFMNLYSATDRSKPLMCL